MIDDPHVGLWTTEDGLVRHPLLAGGRRDEARGTRDGACRGTHRISGPRIDRVDADALHRGGTILRRQPA